MHISLNAAGTAVSLSVPGNARQQGRQLVLERINAGANATLDDLESVAAWRRVRDELAEVEKRARGYAAAAQAARLERESINLLGVEGSLAPQLHALDEKAAAAEEAHAAVDRDVRVLRAEAAKAKAVADGEVAVGIRGILARIADDLKREQVEAEEQLRQAAADLVGRLAALQAAAEDLAGRRADQLVVSMSWSGEG